MFCYPFIVQYIQYILAYLNVCEFNIRILLLGKEKVFFYAEFIKSCVKSEYIGKGTGKILYRKLLSGDSGADPEGQLMQLYHCDGV